MGVKKLYHINLVGLTTVGKGGKAKGGSVRSDYRAKGKPSKSKGGGTPLPGKGAPAIPGKGKK